jgi:O-antigen ligase
MTIARAESLGSPLVVVVLALAGAVILLSFAPWTLFLSWAALAPFLQAYGSHGSLGHPLGLALYQAPPLVFLLYVATRSDRHGDFGFVDVLPMAFLLYVYGSLLVTSEPSTTLIRNVYFTIGIGVILYYFFAFGPVESVTPLRLAKLLLILSTIEAVMSIVDGLTGWNLWNDKYSTSATAVRRSLATLGSPAVLGAFIGMGVVLALSVLVWGGPGALRRIAAANIALGLPGLFFTYTRGPIVATIVAGTLVLISRARGRVLALVSVAAVAAVVLASWGRITHSHVYADRVTRGNTVEIRAELDRWSWKLAVRRPVFGWGYGSFDRVVRSSDLASSTIARKDVIPNTSHNTFLTILVEYGFLGLALLAIPWIVIAGRGVRQAVRSRDARWMLVGTVAALLTYVLAANAIDYRFFSFVPAVAWLLLGFLRRQQRTVKA